MQRRAAKHEGCFRSGAPGAAHGTTPLRFSRFASPGGEPVKQDVVLVASEDAETRRELAERLDWDDVPFHLASSAQEAFRIVSLLSAGTRLFVVLDFARRARARVMDTLRSRTDLDVQLLLLHDAQ